MNTIFKDIDHEQFYEGNLRMTHSQHDPYRQAFFYVLGITPQTRQHIQDLYDYEEQAIRLDALEQGWQTSTSIKMTRLAFNLYNGYSGDSETRRDNPSQYSPYQLFDTGLMPYFLKQSSCVMQNMPIPWNNHTLPFHQQKQIIILHMNTKPELYNACLFQSERRACHEPFSALAPTICICN